MSGYLRSHLSVIAPFTVHLCFTFSKFFSIIYLDLDISYSTFSYVSSHYEMRSILVYVEWFYYCYHMFYFEEIFVHRFALSLVALYFIPSSCCFSLKVLRHSLCCTIPSLYYYLFSTKFKVKYRNFRDKLILS